MSTDLWPDEDVADGGLVPGSMFDDDQRVGLSAPDTWYPWVTQLFPTYTTAPFAKHHAEFWDWIWSIEPDEPSDPFVGIWARGGGKSTGIELGANALGVRGKRRYAWYVRATQDAADGSVQNIAGLLESDAVARHYPSHGERRVGKFGDSRGWRRNRLRTAGGFTIDALGLDTAARGLKVDEDRPDIIILDDIDDKHDTLKISLKKIATITTSILPAMAKHGTVAAVQNLIIPNGFFGRMADGRADYLRRAKVSGPHPAVRGLKIEEKADPSTGIMVPIIVAGRATWAGQNLDACQHLLEFIGKDAFEKECQHEVFGKKQGVALRFDESIHTETLSDDQAKELVRKATRSRQTMALFAGIDFGAWRFGFSLRVVDSNGVVHQIAEMFSQREGIELRARKIDIICKHYGCPDGFLMVGDNANQQDIIEINLAFERIKSNYRVIPVRMGEKARPASVDRMNDLLDRRALRYRRDVVGIVADILADSLKKPREEFLSWRLGWTSSLQGVVMTNQSRLVYEAKEWAYPPTDEGELQEQDPEDSSADGADLIAADRYGIMTWWSATQEATPPKPHGEDTDTTRIAQDGKPVLGGQRDRMMEQFQRDQQRQQTANRTRGAIRKPGRGRGGRVVDL